MRWIWTAIALAVLALAVYLAWWPSFAGLRGAGLIERPRDRPFFRPDPTSWDRFLAEVVVEDGNVRYDAALGAARAHLDDYLEQAARATPAQFADDRERLAFYLNAYNALTIEGVLRRWPIDSVEDAGPFHRFFRDRAYTVAGVLVSLHGFETRVIRRYDPRLHFALNCASASCPPLRAEAYRAEKLEAQLREDAALFVNDARFNRYDAGENTWSLSKIFEWYADDFGGESGVRALLRRHARVDWPDGAVLTYQAYDWSLNHSKGARE